MSDQKVFGRVLLKASGEMLGDDEFNFSPRIANFLVEEVREIHSMVQMVIVVGGGNFFRGASGSKEGIDRVSADHMGMLATLMNGIGLLQAFQRAGIDTRLQNALGTHPLAEAFHPLEAQRHLDKGRVVIFAGGTGNPFFSTDTAAMLRASEIKAEVVLKGTKVDGIYDSDPLKNPQAVRFESITCDEVIRRDLKVMDAMAFTHCKEQKMPIIVFDLFKKGNLKRLVFGEQIGSRVTVD